MQTAGRLLTGGPLDWDNLGEGGKRMILRETGFENMDALLAALSRRAAAAEKLIFRYLETR
mgnify:CR=1 FL=1